MTVPVLIDAPSSHKCPIREDVIGSGPPCRGAKPLRPRSSSPCPAATFCRAAAFNSSSSASVCADPMCSIFRAPRRFENTIWTAVTPEEVFTVRTYGATRTR
jgi:hypothetical protein